jgi:hypothetical protein
MTGRLFLRRTCHDVVLMEINTKRLKEIMAR